MGNQKSTYRAYRNRLSCFFLIDLALKIGRMNPLMPKVKG